MENVVVGVDLFSQLFLVADTPVELLLSRLERLVMAT